MARNAGYLVSGKGVGGVLQLASMGVAGRALGPEAFGVLVLVHTYALTASGVAKFQSWQAIIQYGAPHLHSGDRRKLADVVTFAFSLDAAAGVLTALAAAALLPLLAGAVGIPAEHVMLGLVYCALIPTLTAASPTGVLRLLDDFRSLGVQSTVTPALRLVGVSVAALLNAPFVAYAAIWWLSDFLGDVILWLMALAALKRRDVLSALRFRPLAAPRDNPGIWRFVAATNLNTSLALVWGPLSNLIVGGMLGPAAAGGYRVALSIVQALSKPADLATKSFYPELAHLQAAGDAGALKRLAVRAAGLAAPFAAGLTLLAVLAGPWLVALVMGEDYRAAGWLLAVMAPALLIALPSFPLEPVLLSIGRAGQALVARLAASAGYLALLLGLTHAFGLTGAGIAFVAGAVMLAIAQGTPFLLAGRPAR
ncbi:MAG: lipopolysaccharide biosynthesis protein [Caulobacteraceae bacterium]|nr:lipopolysaccharide biosynthesis protein [Caulobacteraceae bacterium]